LHGSEEAKSLAGGGPPPESHPCSDTKSGENYGNWSTQFAANPNRRFQFNKRSQPFISAHNETPSVAAMSVSNPDCSPFEIQR